MLGFASTRRVRLRFITVMALLSQTFSFALVKTMSSNDEDVAILEDTDQILLPRVTSEEVRKRSVNIREIQFSFLHEQICAKGE